MDDYSIFIERCKQITPSTFNLFTVRFSYKHLYERCKQRSVDWISVLNSLDYVFKHKLCYIVYELNKDLVSSMYIKTDDFMVYIGLYENIIQVRTVITKDNNEKRKTDKYINLTTVV